MVLYTIFKIIIILQLLRRDVIGIFTNIAAITTLIFFYNNTVLGNLIGQFHLHSEKGWII